MNLTNIYSHLYTGNKTRQDTINYKAHQKTFKRKKTKTKTVIPKTQHNTVVVVSNQSVDSVSVPTHLLRYSERLKDGNKIKTIETVNRRIAVAKSQAALMALSCAQIMFSFRGTIQEYVAVLLRKQLFHNVRKSRTNQRYQPKRIVTILLLNAFGLRTMVRVREVALPHDYISLLIPMGMIVSWLQSLLNVFGPLRYKDFMSATISPHDECVF